MKRQNRLIWLGAIALILIGIMIFVPPSSRLNSGSTYNRAPDGYGAWYAFMQKKGINIQRWQKPVSQLPTNENNVTLLQVNSSLIPEALNSDQIKWVEQGNNLVILGVQRPVTASQFTTLQTSPFGNVKINTSRRHKTISSEQVALGDGFGAVVWQEKFDKGIVIYATTSYLAANAYQEETGNFPYLANLVTKNAKKIYVDEYIHNYKDSDVQEQQGEADIFSYFVKTPLFPIFVQICVLLLVLIWAKNRRFGKLTIVETPPIDNSQAYIQALALVLQKAQATDFVVEMVGKEEQIQLQKALGLGQTPIESQILLDIWQQKHGNTITELEEILEVQSQKRRISELNLNNWLEKWQTLRKIHNSHVNIPN
jgi:hypothetical protein